LLLTYEVDFLDKSQLFDTYDLPQEGTAESYSDMLVAHGVKFVKGAKTQIALLETTTPSQSLLITLIANSGIRGLVRVPHSEDECSKLLDAYSEFINARSQRISTLIHERTTDEDVQEKTREVLIMLILNT